ncbi:MAG: hypothetical protein H0T61_00870 [Actinobacteria bacterium]|nr:hypothetical protein [Actinomycetota bacterium]
MPPGLLRLGIAAVGVLALAVGVVALLNGRSAGGVFLAGGAALVLWSVYGHRLRR